MKLIRFGPSGSEKPGLIDANGIIRDLSAEVMDIGGDAIGPDGLARIGRLDPSTLPAVDGEPRLGAPVTAVGKVIGVGMNYKSFAAQMGMEHPPEPILFMKATSSLCGPDDPIIIPRGAQRTDWEVELAIVIGSRAHCADETAAAAAIAGYTVCNELSERDYQFERGGNWSKGKSFDGFAHLGPWLVTADAVTDPHDLGLWLDLNGTRMQQGNTDDMIFPIPYLVSYISQFMTLLPGDVISTGTPLGIGMLQDPPRYLQPGDQVALGIDGLGEQHQTCVAWSADLIQ